MHMQPICDPLFHIYDTLQSDACIHYYNALYCCNSGTDALITRSVIWNIISSVSFAFSAAVYVFVALEAVVLAAVAAAVVFPVVAVFGVVVVAAVAVVVAAVAFVADIV